MTFREYKQRLRARGRLRKHANEENWETEEISRWISNDEGLYEAAYDAVRHGYMDPAGALRSLVEEYGVPNVDLDLVDWDALVAEVDEDTAEQMGYEAQQMLNPPPTLQQQYGHLPPDENPLMWQAGDVVEDRRGARSHVQGPIKPNEFVPMTHIAPDQHYHGQDFSLHPAALVDTYGYRRVDNKPLDYNWLADPSLDQPGDTYLPEGWTAKRGNLTDFEDWPVAQNPNDPYLEARYGPWRAVWKGGRLADIYHDESDGAVEAMQVGAYDWQNGRLVNPVTPESLSEKLRDWADESGGDYTGNVVPYR